MTDEEKVRAHARGTYKGPVCPACCSPVPQAGCARCTGFFALPEEEQRRLMRPRVVNLPVRTAGAQHR